ncbi:MAG: extracellular solute-binding protein, partial [Clostridiales bacterium]|nr:extracellular solute-binding protein [Clostridiales bacterium]
MKKMLRFSSVLLAIILAVSLFSGCGLFNGDKPSEDTQAAKTTADVAATADASTPELAKTWPEFAKYHAAKTVCFEMGWTGPEKDKDFITPEIEKRTNFLFKYEPMTLSTGDDMKQKLNLMIASKDVPEIFFGGSDPYDRSIFEKLGEAGVIWDVAPYIKNYQNIYNLLKPELILYRTKEKKANYYLPTQTGRGNDLIHNATQGLFVRDDFLKKLNMEYPTTPEEFYTYLKRSKEEIKTVNGKPIIGYVTDENFAALEWSLIQPFWPINPDNSNGLTFDPRDNFKVMNYIYTDSPELMRAAKFISKLYREGLMDREILTLKRAQY